MDGMRDYVKWDGTLLRPFPRELFTDKDAVLHILHEMRARICEPILVTKNSPAPFKELYSPCGTTRFHGDPKPLDFMIRMVECDCFSAEDVRDILSRQIQFHQMQRYLDASAGESSSDALLSESVDLLLFALELAIPDVDRLRKTRVRPEIGTHLVNRQPMIACGVDSSGYILPDAEAKGMLKKGAKSGVNMGIRIPPIPSSERLSPRQLLASWAWEKKLRNDKTFEGATKYALARMRNEFGEKAPYWMFSLVQRVPEVKFSFLAFNADFQFDAKASQEVMDSLEEGEFFDPNLAEEPDAAPLRYNVLWRLCNKFSLAMVGTPFLKPALADELHIFAQQVLVTGHDNAIQVRIPAFYKGHDLGSLLDSDFSDLRRVIAGDTNVVAYDKVRKPDVNTCPLGDAEVGEAISAARKVLEKSMGMSKWQSFVCALRLASFWWTGCSYNSAKDVGSIASYDASGRISRFVRSPTEMPETEKYYKPPKRHELVRDVQAHVGNCPLPSRNRYAWAKFYKTIVLANRI